MKKKLLALMIICSIAGAMEREKKRPLEIDKPTSTNGRPFDFHSKFKFAKNKKNILQPTDFITLIQQLNGKAIAALLDNNKVLLEQRLNFYVRASVAIFCKNPQLNVKDKTSLLTQIKFKASELKHKLMRKHIESQPPETRAPRAMSQEEWLLEFRNSQLKKLCNAYEQINEEDKRKLRTTQTVVSHLLDLATIQKNNSDLRLNPPALIPHEFYLGYARVMAHKDNDAELITILENEDTTSNKLAYESWLGSFWPHK